MIKVNISSHSKEIYCDKGENLLDIIRDNGVFVDAPCNGSMSCGKCKVRLLSGNVDSEITTHISEEEVKNGYILACATTVVEDIKIEVPSK